MSILYNLGKANVVPDASSRLSIGITTLILEEKGELTRDVHRLAQLGVRHGFHRRSARGDKWA